jgi:2-oxoglutarate dehydrogenase complex dehydrogenase (E1) component-like enzyme
MRPCEHYADNFANKHGSQEALQEGFKVFQRYNINEFDDFKKAWDEYIEKNKDEVIKKCSLQEAKEKGVKIYNLPFLISLVKLIGDPDHPSFISRANKIAKALKNRFGVEISQERDK